MIWSYVKTISRNISTSKVYFFINVAGLAVGFTVFTLIMLFVMNELSYDTFNKKANRIYRVVEVQKSTGSQSQQVAITMPALAPTLKREFPEIESTARFIPWATVLCHAEGKPFYENGLAFADSSIFNIFTFHFIEGNPSTALDGPYNIVIDRTTADKYFGNTDPLGKTIRINADLGHNTFVVTGVIKDFPENSHLRFNMIASLSALEKNVFVFSGWATNDVVTYVLLRKGYSRNELDKALPEFLKTNLPENLWSGLRLNLQPLKRIHLHSGHILYQVNHNKGSIDNVRLFSLIAFFVIFLACINFINLTTARSAIRTREVGIRKLLGSYHSHLIYQFIGEAVVISFVGLLLSLPLVEAILPTFNSMMHGRIIMSYENQAPFLAGLCLVALLVGLIAGVYPAFYLTSFHPADLLKGRFTSSTRGVLLRKVLTVLQFGIAVGLVTATSIIIRQMNYVYSKPLGFSQKDLMYVPLRDAQSRAKIPLLMQRLVTRPDISATSAGELTGSGRTQMKVSVLGAHGWSRRIVREGFVDYDYARTMGMKILKGRFFSPMHPSDSLSVVINEAAMKAFRLSDPLGKEVKTFEGSVYKIIGVVKDFNYFSLRNKIDPLIMWLEPDRCQYLVIKIGAKDRGSTIHFVRATWISLLPGHPFEYGFLSNYIDEQYGNERQNEHLLILFSLVAVLVASLGLFGLTLHTTEQRIKEIGIRKVLGASLGNIVFMLSRETVVLVAIACMLAWPVAYYFMEHWIDGFAYRITLSPITFLLSGFLVFTVAMITLSFQVIKAGLSNPTEALRYE